MEWMTFIKDMPDSRELCFGCGKEFVKLETPMRCAKCVKNKIHIKTSPISDSSWVLKPEEN